MGDYPVNFVKDNLRVYLNELSLIPCLFTTWSMTVFSFSACIYGRPISSGFPNCEFCKRYFSFEPQWPSIDPFFNNVHPMTVCSFIACIWQNDLIISPLYERDFLLHQSTTKRSPQSPYVSVVFTDFLSVYPALMLLILYKYCAWKQSDFCCF